MYAFVARIDLAEEHEDEAITAYLHQGLVAFRAASGYIDSVVYVDRDTHTVVVVSHWLSRVRAVAAYESRGFKDFCLRLRATLGVVPCVTFCEVLAFPPAPIPFDPRIE